jgi:hypothetical protein
VATKERKLRPERSLPSFGVVEAEGIAIIVSQVLENSPFSCIFCHFALCQFEGMGTFGAQESEPRPARELARSHQRE